MPFGEALAWFGLTLVGIAGYFLVEKYLKVGGWIAVTAVGIAAIGYAVYHQHHPESPNPPVWVILLMLTWGMFGYLAYDRRRKLGPPSVPSKLKIHSAFYGTDIVKRDISSALQGMVRGDALAVRIDDRLLQDSPAIPTDGRTRQIEVNYSFDGVQRHPTSRPERTLLVLPRDEQLIEETAAEYERKRKVDVITLETQLQEKERDCASNLEEIGRYRRELNRLEDEKAKLTDKIKARMPLVAPIGYGMLDRPVGSVIGQSSHGLTMSNDGTDTAYDISIPAFVIGEWNINFGPILRLGAGGQASSYLQTWHNHQGSDDIMGPIIMTQQANGTLGDPIPFKIIFRNAEDTWFVSLCEFRFNPTGIGPEALEARFIRREPFVS